jgi:T-complex protein 1 subunit gamma
MTDTKTQRQTGRSAQLGNIRAAKAVANLVRTTLGPRSMLKMLLDPMGSIVLTNDGHCLLREVDVSHPCAKSMLELSRSQDEEVGDGTTSVIVVAAEILSVAEPFLMQNVHPTVLVQAYQTALHVAMDILDAQAVHVNVALDSPLLRQLVTSALSTKFSSRWNDVMVDLALQSVLTVATPGSAGDGGPAAADATNGNHSPRGTDAEVDLKRYARVEKIPGGEMSDCKVLSGVMFQKDPVHAAMRRKIVNPRILLLDLPLEYKKGESQTHMELTGDQDWNELLKLEEEYVKEQCQHIIAARPDVVITEKGVSDLAQHYLVKAGITAFRRLRKTDNNRVARAVGATIVSRVEEIAEDDIGTGCGLFEMIQLDGEWWCCLVECRQPKACTIVLRGGSKDVLNEMERNLQDAMQVCRNVVYEPSVVCGGGAVEMALAVGLKRASQQGMALHDNANDDRSSASSAFLASGVQRLPIEAVGEAMEIIPKTLAQNCGVNVIRSITALRAKHAAAYEASDATKGGGTGTVTGTGGQQKWPRCTWGINGVTGEIVDMEQEGVWEPLAVKKQVIKSAIENACMILRIDDIVSGSKKQDN